MLPCKNPDTERKFITQTFYTKTKKQKFNKDGSPCRTHTNRIKGQSGEVYAFRTKEEISKMLDVFDTHIAGSQTDEQKRIACRNKMLFIIGINLGIRASDLRRLQWKDFLAVQNGKLTTTDGLRFQPQKTKKKYVMIYFNQAVWNVLSWYAAMFPIKDMNDYVFKSRKGGEPISVAALWSVIKNTAKEAGIKQNIGSHSLRKTFGYWSYQTSKDKAAALVRLQKIFNHSSTLVTMTYIGLMDEDIKENFMNINLGIE